MEPRKSNGSLWTFLRKREAVMTSPGYSTAAGAAGGYAFSAADMASWQEASPPAEVPVGWDPQATWLPSPETPALPALPKPVPPATIATTPYTAASTAMGTGTPVTTAANCSTGSKPRSGFAAAWNKLKQRFGRSSRRGGRRSGSDDRELLGASAAAASPFPPGAAPSSGRQPPGLHATGSAPVLSPPPPQAPATLRSAFYSSHPSRIPRPLLLPAAQPQPQYLMPSPATVPYSGNGTSSGTAAPSAGSTQSSSAMPSSRSRLLQPVGAAPSSKASTGSAPVTPAPQGTDWQQRQGGRVPVKGGGTAYVSPGGGGGAMPSMTLTDDGTARRLVFSPQPTRTAGHPASQPIPIAGRSDLEQFAEWRTRSQQPAPIWHPGLNQVAQSQGQVTEDGLCRSGSLPMAPDDSCRFTLQCVAPRLSSEVLFSGAAGGIGTGAASGRLLPPLTELLGVPRGLVGHWARDDAAGADAGGVASVHALLQMPPLQAAAWEQTRELQVTESDEELALQWTTQLLSGSMIRRSPEIYPKSCALATVPRLDGRSGTAAAQLVLGIDGTLGIKSIQGPPLPAIIHRKFRLSTSRGRLRTSLKVQLLEEGEEWRRVSIGGSGRGGTAKQIAYWRRTASPPA